MKKIILACIALVSYSIQASEATARNLIASANYATALDEINRMPQAQWQQKKKLLFALIDAWNPALQPELLARIATVAQNNMAQGHAVQVYQRALKKSKTAPPAPVAPKAPKAPRVPVQLPPPVPVQPAPPVPNPIDEALKDPTIPADLQKELNDLAPNQREQVEQALNRSQNASQWQKAGAALIGGIGALGLRWLWDWYHGPEGQAPQEPGEPEEAQKKPIREKEKKEKEEKEEKAQEAEEPITHTPEFAQYVEKYKNSIVANGFPSTIAKYRAAINAQPQTFENLIIANKQLIYLEQTLSFKSIRDILATSPAIQKQMIEYDLYPVKELYVKEQELLDGYMIMARQELTRIEKQQEAFEREIKRLTDNKSATKDIVHELEATTIELKNAFNQLLAADAGFATPVGIKNNVNNLKREEFSSQLKALKARIKQNGNEISKLAKSVGGA